MDTCIRWSRAVLAAALLCAGASATARAAEPREVAKQHFTMGMKLYNLGDYKKAREEFRSAYLAVEDPVFLFNIGQCARMLGDPEEAARSYRAYLREKPDAPNRADVEKFIANADRELDLRRNAANAAPTGPLEPGAAGTGAAKTGTGAAPTSGTGTATTGTGTTATGTTATGTGTTAPAEPGGGSLAATDATARTSAPAEKPLYQRWWFWTIIGGAAVLLVAATVAVLLIPNDASIPTTTFGNTGVHF